MGKRDLEDFGIDNLLCFERIQNFVHIYAVGPFCNVDAQSLYFQAGNGHRRSLVLPGGHICVLNGNWCQKHYFWCAQTLGLCMCFMFMIFLDPVRFLGN